jgi:two-component system, LuxR family, response regulator FixJ
MPLLHSQSPQSEIQKQICIVDDDDAVADSLQALLESFGFDVQSYGSKSEFLADERHRAAGCLLIDQHMPGTSGLDVVDNLRKRGIQLPTILISGRLDASIRERAIRLGVRELLDKPVPASRLIQAIRAIL